MRPTHRVTSGPHEGTECFIHAIGPRSVSIRFSRPGWPFPVYGAVKPSELQKITPTTATDGQALI